MAHNAAHGAVLAKGDGASSESFAPVPQVIAGPNGGGYTSETIEAFPHDSAVVIKKVSKVTPTPITGTLNYDSSDAVHAAMRAAAKNKTVGNWRLTMTDGGAEVLDFSGIVSRFEVTNDPEGFVAAEFEITPLAAYTES